MASWRLPGILVAWIKEPPRSLPESPKKPLKIQKGHIYMNNLIKIDTYEWLVELGGQTFWRFCNETDNITVTRIPSEICVVILLQKRYGVFQL